MAAFVYAPREQANEVPVFQSEQSLPSTGAAGPLWLGKFTKSLGAGRALLPQHTSVRIRGAAFPAPRLQVYLPMKPTGAATHFLACFFSLEKKVDLGVLRDAECHWLGAEQPITTV